MSRVVVDASIAVKWVVPELMQAEALSLIAGWNANQIDVIVPSWFSCEVANVLFHRHRRGDLPLDGVRRALQVIMDHVSVEPAPPVTAFRAVELAVQLDQKASYDAFYLAMAEWYECDYWTADERFWVAARERYPRIRWLGNADVLMLPAETDAS